jgi:hypothetical protein
VRTERRLPGCLRMRSCSSSSSSTVVSFSSSSSSSSSSCNEPSPQSPARLGRRPNPTSECLIDWCMAPACSPLGCHAIDPSSLLPAVEPSLQYYDPSRISRQQQQQLLPSLDQVCRHHRRRRHVLRALSQSRLVRFRRLAHRYVCVSVCKKRARHTSTPREERDGTERNGTWRNESSAHTMRTNSVRSCRAIERSSQTHGAELLCRALPCLLAGTVLAEGRQRWRTRRVYAKAPTYPTMASRLDSGQG